MSLFIVSLVYVQQLIDELRLQLEDGRSELSEAMEQVNKMSAQLGESQMSLQQGESLSVCLSVSLPLSLSLSFAQIQASTHTLSFFLT